MSMTKEQIIRTLKDNHLGKNYSDWDAESYVSGVIKPLVKVDSDKYFVSSSRDHNKVTIRLVDRDTYSLKIPIIEVTVRKTKTATHHSWRCTWAEYAVKDFEIDYLCGDDLESAVESAVQDIEKALNARKDSRALLKEQIIKVQEALGISRTDVYYWCKKVNDNWYTIKWD